MNYKIIFIKKDLVNLLSISWIETFIQYQVSNFINLNNKSKDHFSGGGGSIHHSQIRDQTLRGQQTNKLKGLIKIDNYNSTNTNIII